MDKITEIAIKDLIRRVERLEDKQSRFPRSGSDGFYPKVHETIANNIASKKQKDYLRSLGGRVWDDITKQQAGKAIDEILNNRKIAESVVEPPEVDTDDAGLDEEDLM